MLRCLSNSLVQFCVIDSLIIFKELSRKECAWDITSTSNSRTLDMGLRNDTLFQPDGGTLQIQKSMLTLIYIYIYIKRERERERK